MAKRLETRCTIEDVEWTYRVAAMLLGDVRDLQREFAVFRDGDSDNREPPGNPKSLRQLLTAISERCGEHEKCSARISSVLLTANKDRLTPFVYQSRWIDADHEPPITALDAVAELADIASDACARLVFNVDGDGQPRTEIPAAKSRAFRGECAECERAMAAVTSEELTRLQALLKIEEARTLDGMCEAAPTERPPRWVGPFSHAKWLAIHKQAGCEIAKRTFERRIAADEKSKIKYVVKEPRENNRVILDCNSLPLPMQSLEF